MGLCTAMAIFWASNNHNGRARSLGSLCALLFCPRPFTPVVASSFLAPTDTPINCSGTTSSPRIPVSGEKPRNAREGDEKKSRVALVKCYKLEHERFKVTIDDSHGTVRGPVRRIRLVTGASYFFCRIHLHRGPPIRNIPKEIAECGTRKIPRPLFRCSAFSVVRGRSSFVSL